jgi:hypothetical protein
MMSESPEPNAKETVRYKQFHQTFPNYVPFNLGGMRMLPGSIMLRQQTRKYLPQAVPKSTLSVDKHKMELLNEPT